MNMEHDHDEEEEEGDEHLGHSHISPEAMKRIKDKFQKFIADVADDMLEPGQVELIAKNMDKKLRSAGVLPNLSTMKAFAEGFDFGVLSSMQLEERVAMVMAGIRKVIKDKTGVKPKLDIDITKSKPLPPEPEDNGSGK